MTEQRRIIARVLAAADDHPDVEELYRRCAAVDDRISISTVYRTVKLFEDAGIIERHEFRNGRARYEQMPDTPPRPSHQSAHRRGDRVPVGGDRTPASGGRAPTWLSAGRPSTRAIRHPTRRQAETVAPFALANGPGEEKMRPSVRCAIGLTLSACLPTIKAAAQPAKYPDRPAQDRGRILRRRRHRRGGENAGAEDDRKPGPDCRGGKPPGRERHDRRRSRRQISGRRLHPDDGQPDHVRGGTHPLQERSRSIRRAISRAWQWAASRRSSWSCTPRWRRIRYRT